MHIPSTDEPMKVGDVLYRSPDGITRCDLRQLIDIELAVAGMFDNPPPDLMTIEQVRVVAIRQYRLITDGEVCTYVPVMSALERQYKVIRNGKFGDETFISLIDKEGDKYAKVPWPESKPFHDAFGPVEEGAMRQVIYVNALVVDGHYKLLEVLDDQDW